MLVSRELDLNKILTKNNHKIVIELIKINIKLKNLITRMMILIYQKKTKLENYKKREKVNCILN